EILVRCSGYLVGEPESESCTCDEAEGDDEAGFEQKGGAHQRPREAECAQHADLLTTVDDSSTGDDTDSKRAEDETEREIASQEEGEDGGDAVEAGLVKRLHVDTSARSVESPVEIAGGLRCSNTSPQAEEVSIDELNFRRLNDAACRAHGHQGTPGITGGHEADDGNFVIMGGGKVCTIWDLDAKRVEATVGGESVNLGIVLDNGIAGVLAQSLPDLLIRGEALCARVEGHGSVGEECVIGDQWRSAQRIRRLACQVQVDGRGPAAPGQVVHETQQANGSEVLAEHGVRLESLQPEVQVIIPRGLGAEDYSFDLKSA